MGLALVVGILSDLKAADPEGCDHFRQIFEQVNSVLATERLPPHREPENIPRTDEISYDMYGYSGLHYLRRIAAHLTFANKLPGPGDDKAHKDPLLTKYYAESLNGNRTAGFFNTLFSKRKVSFGFNHLMQHSDCEGFYLPIDFTNVIFPDSALRIPGDMIGSSYRLAKESKALAQALGIPADLDPESDELWDACSNQGTGSGWKRYGIESFTCIRLIGACEASIRSGAAVVFS